MILLGITHATYSSHCQTSRFLLLLPPIAPAACSYRSLSLLISVSAYRYRCPSLKLFMAPAAYHSRWPYLALPIAADAHSFRWLYLLLLIASAVYHSRCLLPHCLSAQNPRGHLNIPYHELLGTSGHLTVQTGPSRGHTDISLYEQSTGHTDIPLYERVTVLPKRLI